ncbi:MAG: glutathione S-transferase [Pseudomonadota bacterium]
MTYEVIGTRRSRAFRVIWMLEELGQPYAHIDALPQSQEARAVNPLGKVPSLRDGETILTDSLAIMTYLADKHGMLTSPAGTLDRAKQDALTMYVMDEMDATLWAAAKHGFVLPEPKRVEGLKPTLAWEYAHAVDVVSERLIGQDFANGDDITITDIVLTHCATWAMVAKMKADNAVFDEYVQRMMARPAYQRATGKT